MMKITGGTLRGRNVEAGQSQDVRPTSSRVREALFNILSHAPGLEGAPSCLLEQPIADICCGSGLLGFEALSRGGAHVTLVDNQQHSLTLAKQNAKQLGVVAQCDFVKSSATKLPPAAQPYSLVLTDPPYDAELLPGILHAIHQQGWAKAGSYVVAELPLHQNIPPHKRFVLWKEKRYGKTRLMFWRYTHER